MIEQENNVLSVADVEKRVLRTWLGQYATGVTIVTTLNEQGQKVGMTANSFSSVSLDPPLILWSIAKTASNVADFCQCERFAINILNEAQHVESNHFSKSSADKFSSLSCISEIENIPVIDEALTTLICRTYQIYEGGDHHIILGEIELCKHNGGKPLLFHNGQYHAASWHHTYNDCR